MIERRVPGDIMRLALVHPDIRKPGKEGKSVAERYFPPGYWPGHVGNTRGCTVRVVYTVEKLGEAWEKMYGESLVERFPGSEPERPAVAVITVVRMSRKRGAGR